MQIKGSLIMDYVKLIRANKDKDWSKWLTPEDMDIVEDRVLPSNWYPFDSWQRMGAAVFNEVAGRNLDLIKSFGPMVMENLLKTYKSVLVPDDPLESIKRFERLRRNFIKGVESDLFIAEEEPGRVKVKMMARERDKEIGDPEAFAFAVSGCIEGLVKKAGAKNVSASVSEGSNDYDIDINWD